MISKKKPSPVIKKTSKENVVLDKFAIPEINYEWYKFYIEVKLSSHNFC